jgi:hypothetical protein
MHLASDYIHPYRSAGGRPARRRVRIYLLEVRLQEVWPRAAPEECVPARRQGRRNHHRGFSFLWSASAIYKRCSRTTLSEQIECITATLYVLH